MPVLQARVSNEELAAIKSLAQRSGKTTSELIRESIASYASMSKRSPTFGCMAGKILIADTFDELPEGFEDYV